MVQVVLAFRGTAGLKDVLADATAAQARSLASSGQPVGRHHSSSGKESSARVPIYGETACLQLPWLHGGKHGHVHAGMYAQFEEGLSSLHSTVRECGHVWACVYVGPSCVRMQPDRSCDPPQRLVSSVTDLIRSSRL